MNLCFLKINFLLIIIYFISSTAHLFFQVSTVVNVIIAPYIKNLSVSYKNEDVSKVKCKP